MNPNEPPVDPLTPTDLEFLAAPPVAPNHQRAELKKSIATARQKILEQANWSLDHDNDHDLVLHPSATYPDIKLRNVFWLTNPDDTHIIRLAAPDFYSYNHHDIQARDFSNLVHCMNVVMVKHFFIKIQHIRSPNSWRFIMYYETLTPMGSLSHLIEKAVRSMEQAIQDFYQLLPTSLRIENQY